MKKKNGFTVLELVMVIAAIAILSGILIPSFFGFNEGAKLSADRSLVHTLNTSLSINESEMGYNPKTMHNAILAVKKDGISVDDLVTKSDSDLLYSIKDGQFFLSSQEEVQSNPNKYEYWKIYTEVPAIEDQIYSVYLNNPTLDSEVDVQVGFDVGYNTLVPSVTYERSGEDSHSVVLRTNGSDVTINAPSDAIKHYGTSDDVIIEDISDSSYFSYGESQYVAISSGRIVVQDTASINGIYIKGDDVIVAQTENSSTPELARNEAVSEVKVQVTDFAGEVQAESLFTISGSTVTIDGDVEASITNPIKDMLSTAKAEENNRLVTKYQARIGAAVAGDDSNYYRTLQDAINQYSTATAALKVYLIKNLIVTSPIVVNDTNQTALSHYLYLNTFTLQGDGCTPLVFNKLTKAFTVSGTGKLAGDANHPCIELNTDFQVSISNATTVGAFKNNAPKQYIYIARGAHTKVGFEGSGHFRLDTTSSSTTATFDIDVTPWLNPYRNTITKNSNTKWTIKRLAKAPAGYNILYPSVTVEAYDTMEHFAQYFDYAAYSIKLLADVTDDFEAPETLGFTMDANGFTFTGKIMNKSSITLKSGVAGGVINLNDFKATTLTINSNVNVTMDSGSMTSTFTLKGNNTTVTINNASFNKTSSSYFRVYTNYTNTLVINNGTFKGSMGLYESGTKHSITVLGGTYRTSGIANTFAKFMPSTHKTVKNSDGTYSIVPK